MSKQNNLTDFLTDVADAIRQKKGTQAPINPQDFSSEIASIPTGGSNPLQDMLDRSSDTNGKYLFYVYDSSIFSKLTYEDLIKLDFSNKHYTSAQSMFQDCASLTAIPQIDFSQVTNAKSMFSGCTHLTTTPQLDFSSVTESRFMFYNCERLTTLDFSNIKTIGGAFAGGSSLSTLIIRNPITLATLTNSSAFEDTPIDWRKGTGYIYVPDDLVDSYKQANCWSDFASQIKPLSELPQGE